MCVCVCVCVREREREKERDIHIYTHTHTLMLSCSCVYPVVGGLKYVFTGKRRTEGKRTEGGGGGYS